MTNTVVRSGSALAVAIASALLAAAAAAEEQSSGVLEEMVVTAQRRSESLSDVPLSVSALSSEKIATAGIDNFEALKYYVPTFFMTQTPTSNSIAIRGIFSGSNNGFEQSVGTYVDGVYHGRGQQARTPFLDLERVEVLRGPQIILFGKNSVAGALNLTTARPTDTLEGSVSALYEPTYEEQVYTAVLSGPLTDRLRGRIAGRYREYGGNVENLTRSRDEAQQEETALRGWLDFDATDDLRLSLKVEHDEFDTLGRPYEVVDDIPATGGRFAGRTYADILANAFGQDASVLNNFPDDKRSANGTEFSRNEMDEYAFFVDWRIGDHSLVSTTAYSKYDFAESADADITAAKIIEQTIDEDFEQWSQELRLVSPTGRPFEYQAGLYWEKTELDSLTRLPIYGDSLIVALVGAAGPAVANTDGPRAFAQDSESYAAFVQGSWHVTESFQANFGLRYTSEDKEAHRSVVFTDLDGVSLTGARLATVSAVMANLLNKRAHDITGDRSEDHIMPSLGVQYRFSDDAMLYATWTRGYKAGGYDSNSNNPPPATPTSPPGAFEFEPEEAESYEIGTKLRFADKVEVNLAGYYTDFTNLQVSSFDGVGFFVTNAGAAEIKGVELDSRWQATPNLLLTAALAWTDFEFTEYTGACPVVIGATPMPRTARCDNAGKPNQYVADWTASASVDYRIPLGDRFELRTMLDAYFNDGFLASPNLDPRQAQDAYTKINGQLVFGPMDGAWDVALVGKNLTDERIMPYGADLPLANSITGGGFSAMRIVEPGRSLALQGTWRF